MDAIITIAILQGGNRSSERLGHVPKVTQSQKGRAGIELGQTDSRVCAPNHSPTLTLIWGLPASGGGHLTKNIGRKVLNLQVQKVKTKRILFPKCLNKRKELQFDP